MVTGFSSGTSSGEGITAGVATYWSDYNHNVSGLFLVIMVLLALGAQTGWVSWACHWLLGFVVLSVFIWLRSDVEGSWPYGQMGFGEGLLHSLRLLLVGYESGAQSILNPIKKGIRIDRAKQFTQDCKKLGILIHGTFILGLPGETPETIEHTIRYACELDVYSLQVSPAAPYPGTELDRQAKEHDWLIKEDLVSGSGIQEGTLSYPELSHEEIFEAVARFYRRFYFRPRPILRILKDMLKDRQVFRRRLREGREFLSFTAKRKESIA